MNRFVALRFERGLTQGDVIEGTGISRGTIYTLEHGGEPSAPIAKKLSEFYGLTVAEILGLTPSSDRSAA